MGMIEEPGRVIIITNYVTGVNLFELLHSDDKKVHQCSAVIKITKSCLGMFYLLSG